MNLTKDVTVEEFAAAVACMLNMEGFISVMPDGQVICMSCPWGMDRFRAAEPGRKLGLHFFGKWAPRFSEESRAMYAYQLDVLVRLWRTGATGDDHGLTLETA